MTSQVLYFEWFLNRRFGRWLQDPSRRITIPKEPPQEWISTSKGHSTHVPLPFGSRTRSCRGWRRNNPDTCT